MNQAISRIEAQGGNTAEASREVGIIRVSTMESLLVILASFKKVPDLSSPMFLFCFHYDFGLFFRCIQYNL
jgi:hypothetical protein